MARFLNKLNSPKIVALALILFLVVDGSLLYRYRATMTTANTPTSVETNSDATNTTSPETAVSEGNTVEEPGEGTTAPETVVFEENTGEESGEGATTSEAAPSQEYEEGTTASEAAPSQEETTAEESPEETTSNTPAASDEPVSETPVLEGLQGSIQECDGNQKECVRRLVEEAIPEAKYLGGRTDLNAYGLGHNKEVLYFEDPTIGPCEYERQEYAANNGLTYAVIVVGSGSFNNKGGAGCIPQT